MSDIANQITEGLKEFAESTTRIRWICRGDMSEVLEIENLCFDYPWTEDDFMRSLRQSDTIGVVNSPHWETEEDAYLMEYYHE